MKVLESAENYLETILILKNRKGVVRSIDIANEMGFSKPSVSVAMKHFRENKLITVGADGEIVLTKEGLEKAEKVYDRHRIISRYLVGIGVDVETAEQDACRIEHVISQSSFDCIKRLVQ